MNRAAVYRVVTPLFLGVLTTWNTCDAQTPGPTVPFTISKETTAIVEPLKADGTVDYVAALNQLFGKGVTADNNGYLIWLQVIGSKAIPTSVRPATLALLGISEKDLSDKAFDSDREPDNLPDQPWKSADRPDVAKFLADNDKFLNLAVAVSAKPAWWDPSVSVDGTMPMILLPWLNWLREVNESLACRSLLRIGGSREPADFDGFVSDVTAIKRLSRLCQGWTLVSRLVCAGIDRLANNAIDAVVEHGSLSAAQCAKLAKALDAIPALSTTADVMDLGERWSMLDVTSTIATGKLPRDDTDVKTFTPLLHLNQGDIDWNIVLRRINLETDRCVALLRDPKIADMQELAQACGKRIADIRSGSMQFANLAKREGETQKAYSNRVADALLLVQMPSFAKAETTFRAARMRDEMVRTLVAAAQFRADNTHWPGQLSDLVPKYLAAVPKDVYSPAAAAAVHYIQVEGGIYIYSVGVNRIDDGGLNDPAQKQDDIGEGIPPKPGEQGL